MKNNTKKLEKINARIVEIREERGILSTYKITDSSIRAELRLAADWSLTYPVDAIHASKDLGGNQWLHHTDTEGHDLVSRNPDSPWSRISDLAWEIAKIASLNKDTRVHMEKISATTKTGPERRAEAKIQFEIEAGIAFLAAHKASVKALPRVVKRISALQAEQKALLPELRRANSEYLTERKNAKSAERHADTEALASGRFWETTRDALKNYFHPPFAKNYLADVSERWRAALFVEAESTGWKNSYGTWTHKLVSTGRAYLCGIDDNGDEWGHRVTLQPTRDNYGNASLTDFSVEEAMGALFGLPKKKVVNCFRQGDLLFCPAAIPSEARIICNSCGSPFIPNEHGGCAHCDYGYARTIPAVELHAQPEPWDVRESHQVSSPGLYRNGSRFRSDSEISVSHTSHAPVMLPPGEYRLYVLQIADAD